MTLAWIRVNSCLRLWNPSLCLAIQDITLHSHTRHQCLQLYMTPPSLAKWDSTSAETCICNTPPVAIHHRARNNWKCENKVIPIVATLKCCKIGPRQISTLASGWPTRKRQWNLCVQNKSETTCNRISITVAVSPLWICCTYHSSRS